MYSSEFKNSSHTGAQNTNPLNKWDSNKSAVQALPANLRVSNRDVGSTKNIRYNMINCSATIAPVSNVVGNKQFTLTISTPFNFHTYTNFSKSNPDTSLVVRSEEFSAWYAQYLFAKNPPQGSLIQPYAPTAIITYRNNLGNKMNYIARISNISYNPGSTLPITIIAFDTTPVVFYDKTSILSLKSSNTIVPATNIPEVTRIDTNFLLGTFDDIKIDFDDLPNPAYDNNRGYGYFFDSTMKVVKNNGNFIVSIPNEDRLVTYSLWSSTSSQKNQHIIVFTDTVSSFIESHSSAVFNRNDTPKDFFAPSTSMQFTARDGTTSTCILQVSDTFIQTNKTTSNLIFELNNQNVKIYHQNGELVSSLESSNNTISKIMTEGAHTQVKMKIDDIGQTTWEWIGIGGIILGAGGLLF